MAERLITLNLRRYLVEQPVTKRQRKAISYIRERVAHYTKVDINNVKIDMPLSESVIKYYSRKMKPIKLSVLSAVSIGSLLDCFILFPNILFFSLLFFDIN